MSRHGAKWWAERVEELAQGGDAEGIARRYGVRAKTLLWWRSELRRRGPKAVPTATRLLPVVVAPSPMRGAPSGAGVEIVIDIGPTRMTMRGSVTAEHLAAIVRSARAC